LKDPDAGKITLIIDGLDECDREYSERLLRGFDWMLIDDGEESIRKLNHIRILISCREEKGIENWCPNHLHARITPEDVTPDILKLVDSEVSRLSQIKPFNDVSPEVVTRLIMSFATGVFLWVRHLLKDLERQEDTSLLAILALITGCPKDMRAYY